jgi:hypothetical protein
VDGGWRAAEPGATTTHKRAPGCDRCCAAATALACVTAFRPCTALGPEQSKHATTQHRIDYWGALYALSGSQGPAVGWLSFSGSNRSGLQSRPGLTGASWRVPVRETKLRTCQCQRELVTKTKDMDTRLSRRHLLYCTCSPVLLSLFFLTNVLEFAVIRLLCTMNQNKLFQKLYYIFLLC